MNRITCINKDDRLNPYEAITHVGGVNSSGGKWKHTQKEVISMIESGRYSFYVENPTGDKVDVIVATSKYGNKYIKTDADGDLPNNLLSLPQCN